MVKQLRSLIAVFALILFAVSLASATISLTATGSQSVSELSDSTTFSFNVSYAGDVENQTIAINGSTNTSGVSVSFSPVSVVLNGTELEISTITGTITGLQGRGHQDILISYNALNGSTIVDSETFTLSVTSAGLCSSGIKDENLSLSDLEDKSDVDDDWEWRALDDIQVRVTLDNTGDKDNEDYKLQLYFFDDTGKDVSSKFVDDKDSLKQDVNNLDKGDDTDVDFTFKLSTDIDSGNYKLVIKAIRKSDEKNQCDILIGDQEVSIDQDDDYAIVSAIDAPMTTSCGSTVDLIATVANTGTNDQDRVKVILYNRDLGLNIYKEIDNMDSGDSTDVLFSFAIPQGAQEKSYKLLFSTEFNYDDHDDSYDDQSDSEDDYMYYMNVAGDCIDYTKPTISARLNSTAMVGEELVVEISLKNNADTAISAIISADEYASWAEFIRVEPSIVSAAKQETKKAYITFKPTQAGQHTFNINVIYNGKTIDQAVTVNVASKTGWLSGAYEQFGKTGTFLLLGIAILVILIILVLVIRAIVSRKD